MSIGMTENPTEKQVGNEMADTSSHFISRDDSRGLCLRARQDSYTFPRYSPNSD